MAVAMASGSLGACLSFKQSESFPPAHRRCANMGFQLVIPVAQKGRVWIRRSGGGGGVMDLINVFKTRRSMSSRRRPQQKVSVCTLLKVYSTLTSFSKSMRKSKLAFLYRIIFPLVIVMLGVFSILKLVIMTDVHRELLARVEDRAGILKQVNDSTFDTVRILDLSSYMNVPSYSFIEKKVSSKLLTAFSTASWVSQASFLGFDGLMLSYYYEGNQTRAIFSNSTFSLNDHASIYRWYDQPVNANNGEKSGEVIVMDAMRFNYPKWFTDGLNGSVGYSYWDVGWGKSRPSMFFFTAPVGKIGAVSLGIKVKDFANYVFDIDIYGGNLYLATKDGHFFYQTGPLHASYMISNC